MAAVFQESCVVTDDTNRMVIDANYEARLCGICSGMPLFIAK